MPAALSDGTKGGCSCLVYANDLSLDMDIVKWLKENLWINQCSIGNTRDSFFADDDDFDAFVFVCESLSLRAFVRQ